MLEKDSFSKWLGIQVDAIGPGYCKLHYRINDQMLNGFHQVHGGILFSAADSALAFACNSHGIITVALDASITFTRPARNGDLLVVRGFEPLSEGAPVQITDRTTLDADASAPPSGATGRAPSGGPTGEDAGAAAGEDEPGPATASAASSAGDGHRRKAQ